MLAVALIPLAAPTGAAADPTVTEFPYPVRPISIAAGPDGNLWATVDSASPRILRITPAGAITEFSTGLSKPPTIITAGPDGNLWFTESANPGRIGRITTAGAVTEFAVPTVNNDPGSITTGPDGNLWFNEAARDAGEQPKIGRITPAGAVTEFFTGLTAQQPGGIMAAPDGNLWTSGDSANGLVRVTPAGAITQFASGRISLASGPDGRLWYASFANPGTLGTVATGTGVKTPLAAAPTPNSSPGSIITGPDANLWFAESANPGRIGRVTAAGAITEFTAGLTPNGQPGGLAAAPDGTIWFTVQRGFARITTDGAPASGNLLRNPGADASTPAAATTRTAPLPGWVTTPNMTPVAYGAAGGFPATAEAARFGGGTAFFAGGPNAPASQAVQNVDVARHAVAIDAGQATANITAQVGGKGAQSDQAVLVARFLDAGLGAISSMSTATVTPVERLNQTGFLGRAASARVPAGTRTIQVVASTRRDVDGYGDGYLDNLSLTLDLAPAAPAAPADGGSPPASAGAGPPGPGKAVAARCTLKPRNAVSTARYLTITITCDRAATVRQTATLRFRARNRKALRLGTISAPVAAGRKTTARLKLSRRTLAAIRRANSRRQRYTVAVQATVTTPGAPLSAASATLARLKLPKASPGRR